MYCFKIAFFSVTMLEIYKPTYLLTTHVILRLLLLLAFRSRHSGSAAPISVYL